MCMCARVAVFQRGPRIIGLYPVLTLSPLEHMHTVFHRDPHLFFFSRLPFTQHRARYTTNFHTNLWIVPIQLLKIKIIFFIHRAFALIWTKRRCHFFLGSHFPASHKSNEFHSKARASRAARGGSRRVNEKVKNAECNSSSASSECW